MDILAGMEGWDPAVVEVNMLQVGQESNQDA